MAIRRPSPCLYDEHCYRCRPVVVIMSVVWCRMLRPSGEIRRGPSGGFLWKNRCERGGSKREIALVAAGVARGTERERERERESERRALMRLPAASARGQREEKVQWVAL
mmetsp:Transcript_36275/g.62845  ORF Transcript_36275/g.62845 Transcript_36275/m.62845 type:complete len:110 (-) Transcript_36275:33-362(-)